MMNTLCFCKAIPIYDRRDKACSSAVVVVIIIIPDLPRLEVMTTEVQPQVFWARVTVGNMYDYWQHLQRHGYMHKTSIKVISSEKDKMFAVPRNPEKGSSFVFLCDHNGQRQICRFSPFSSGCQLLGDTFRLAHNRSRTLLFYYLQEL